MTSTDKLRSVVDRCHVDIFSSTFMVMNDYPLRFETVKDHSPTVSEKSDVYVIDSNIGSGEVTNEEVYEVGEKMGADVVIPKDYQGETMQSLDSFEEFAEMYHDRAYEGEVMVPLQNDDDLTFLGSYHYARQIVEDHDIPVHSYAIGGIKGTSTVEQIRDTIDLREEVGLDVPLHGLGLGCCLRWAKTVRRCPWLLDSMDNDSCGQVARRGGVVDRTLEIKSIDTARGKHSTIPISLLVEFNLMNHNIAMSDLQRDEDVENVFEDAELEQIVARHERWFASRNGDPFKATA